MSDTLPVLLAKCSTASLERWLEQYKRFVRQCQAELDKRRNPELKLEVEIEME